VGLPPSHVRQERLRPPLPLDTQSRFLTIPNIILSSAFDTIYLVRLHGAISTDFDDTLNAGDAPFLSSVNDILKSYSTNRPDHGTIQFAAISARSDATGVHCDAGPYAATIKPLPLLPPLSPAFADPKLLHSLAAKLLWVGRVARPDILTNAMQLATMPNPTGADARRANDTLATLTRLPVTLLYPRLDPATLQISVFANYSDSAVSPLPKHQVGYLIALVDASHRFSLLHWASHCPHRVLRLLRRGTPRPRQLCCSISLLPIGNWPRVAPLTGRSTDLCDSACGTPFGGLLPHCSFFIVRLLACLSALRHSLRSIDRMVDRPVPLFVLNHRGTGVAVVGATRLPIGCPSTKGLSSSPRRR